MFRQHGLAFLLVVLFGALAMAQEPAGKGNSAGLIVGKSFTETRSIQWYATLKRGLAEAE